MTRRSRFVLPTTVQLTLSDGDFIEIKERLTFGEQQKLTAKTLAQEGNLFGGGEVTATLDFAGYKTERMLAYLVDWSFRDADGRVVPVSRAALEALDPETADEIDTALDAHLNAASVDPTPQNGTSPPP
jgi:hypothetical protein